MNQNDVLNAADYISKVTILKGLDKAIADGNVEISLNDNCIKFPAHHIMFRSSGVDKLKLLLLQLCDNEISNLEIELKNMGII